jgi:signal transduction histidine kinase
MPMREESGEVVGVIQYARSLKGVQQTIGRLVLLLLPLGLGGLGAALFGGLYMAGRAMRPTRESFERQRAFVADASHELKTPLTLIRADAEMVLYRGHLNEEDRKLVDHALAETERMSAILSDLLLVARLDAGKADLATKPFDLVSVLSEEAERFGVRAAAKEIRLEVQVPGELPARGDPKRTGQILAVLLENAVRFTPPGGSIALSGRLQDRWVEASVRDTGPASPQSTYPVSSTASTGRRHLAPAAKAPVRVSGSPSPESSRGPSMVTSWPRAQGMGERYSASACLAHETCPSDGAIANVQGQSAG